MTERTPHQNVTFPSNGAHMTREFRKRVSVTPGRYRAQSR